MPASARLLARTVAATAWLALAAGCSNDPVSSGPAPLPNTVSGTLRNVSGAAVPADARVVLVWSGDDGTGDYSYVWGSGPVDAASGRFTVTLDVAPPAAATLGGAAGRRLGVGVPVLVPAGAVREGRVDDPRAFDGALGAAGQYAVIYREGAVPDDEDGAPWTGIREGYNVGRGVPARAGQIFDGFEAVGPSTVELIVDALRNIRFVNWT